MNFYNIIIYGYFIIAALLIYFVNRDRTKPELFFGKHQKLSWLAIGLLVVGIIAAIDTHFVEPNSLVVTRQQVSVTGIAAPVKIAFIADLHVGGEKKAAWIEKLVKNIEKISPDLVLLGGDYIVNFGPTEDESQYLEPLRNLVGKYPIFYVLGNHEYGQSFDLKTGIYENFGDHTREVISRMQDIGIPLLRNDLICPQIKNQKLCIFGVDDVWSRKMNFDNLKLWSGNEPLILLTHNPDAILSYPTNFNKPVLELAAHTHGGQIRLPFIGPLGDADVRLGREYYKGLKTWENIPIFVTVGVAETGGSIRFLNPPEIAVITLTQ